MGGAIRVAEALMPEVWRIKTIAGAVEDTEYWKVAGEWKAGHPSRLADAHAEYKRFIRASRVEH